MFLFSCFVTPESSVEMVSNILQPGSGSSTPGLHQPFRRLLEYLRPYFSSCAFLFAVLNSSAFLCFSACLRSITSTALFIPAISNSLLLWQNSYIRNEPNTNEPTAQLQLDQTVAVSVSHLCKSYDKKDHHKPPQMARTPPIPNPPPMPVKSASRTQGFL